MTKIEVDCNSDTVRINDKIVMQVRYPNSVIKLLVETFNEISDDKNATIYVTLLKIDEDHRTVVGEW